MSSRIISKSTLVLSCVVASGLLLSSCGASSWFGRGDKNDNASIDYNDPVISQTAGELVERLQLSDKANADLNANYRNDPNNKAFAASPSGAFGVAFGATTMREAKQAALEKCMQDVVPGDLECIVYDVNGTRVFRPTELRRVR